MFFRIMILLVLLISIGASAAEEVRSPVCPVSFGNSPCVLTGTNSPGVLSDYEQVYLNISNGYYIDGANFYYAGMNYKNTEIDLFSKRYNIISIDTSDAILTYDLYKNENNLQLHTGKELALMDGYTLELIDSGENNALFYLKRNNEILEKGSVDRDQIFSHKITVNGKEVEIFRTKISGIFGNSTTIKNTYLRDILVIKNRESSGDYEIKLNDIDGDKDIDIVYSLKNNYLDLPDNGKTSILDTFTLRTYPLYVPFYLSFKNINLTGNDDKFRIYSLNNNLTMTVPLFFSSPPEGSIIASSVPVRINTKPNITYKGSNSDISELREDHTFYTFYIYTKGNVDLSVQKQDMNWYNGSDALEIKLYSGENKLIKNITIPDDGNMGNRRSRGIVQNGTLGYTLEEGIYKVTMSGGNDILIRSIELNSGSIVVQNPFLAGALYTKNTGFDLYTKAVKGDRLGFTTYHVQGLQKVNISGASFNGSVSVDVVNKWFYIDLPPDNELYHIEVPKGDLIINANGYFSFSNDSYFSTSSVEVIPLQNSMELLQKNKVDYVIVPSTNPFTGLYLYKINTAASFSVRSPKSPWTDHTIDTWSAPNIFYFDPDKNNTWEYLIINNSGTNTLNKNRLKYITVQSQDNIGYRGNLYKVLYETSSEMILSKKISDLENKTLLINKEWQVGGTYTLALKDVDGDGKYAVIELKNSNKPVSRQIVAKGSKLYYNISFKENEVIIFQSKLDEIFQGANKSFVKLSDVELYDENMTVIKSGVSKGNETERLYDFNGDGYQDIEVTLNINFNIDKSSRKTLFDSYLDMVVESNGKFYLERKVVSALAEIGTLNIKKKLDYTLASFFQGNNMKITFPDFDITAVMINASLFIDQVDISLREFKNRPDNIIINPEGIVYKYFSISLGSDNLKNGIVDFRVNSSWMAKENISNSSISLYVFTEGEWDVLPTYIVGSDEKYVYYSSNIYDFSAIFAISGGEALTRDALLQFQPSIEQNDLKTDLKTKNQLEYYQQNTTETTSTSSSDSDGNSNTRGLYPILLLVSTILSGYFVFKKFGYLINRKIAIFLSEVSFEAFNSLFITYLLLLLIETIWDNSVVKYIDLNYLMVIVLFIGIISLFGKRDVNKTINSGATKKD
ncbi:MAG: PGF-pre-PGF domain-containing protein [Candidatus Methanoperedens sp.]